MKADQGLTDVERAALRAIVAGRTVLRTAAELVEAGTTAAALDRLASTGRPADALVVRWPALREDVYTLTPLAAERLGVELDDRDRWITRDWPGDLADVLAGLALQTPGPSRIPGDRLYRPGDLDRALAPDEAEGPDALDLLLDPISEKPVTLWGREIPIDHRL